MIFNFRIDIANIYIYYYYYYIEEVAAMLVMVSTLTEWREAPGNIKSKPKGLPWSDNTMNCIKNIKYDDQGERYLQIIW